MPLLMQSGAIHADAQHEKLQPHTTEHSCTSCRRPMCVLLRQEA